MPWGAVAGAVVGSVANAALKDDGGGGGGGGGSSVSKEPWSAAAPWLQNNIAQGQQLQAQYLANPFSATQQRAYGQQFANSDYMRSLMEAVNSQAGGNRPFNRGSPGMVPQRYNLPSSRPGMQNMGLGPSYGNVASIFGAPQAAPVPVQPQPVQQQPQVLNFSTQQLDELREALASRRWRDGD
jgi:hypothetical protein